MSQYPRGPLPTLLTLKRPGSIQKNFGVQKPDGTLVRLKEKTKQGKVVLLGLEDGTVLFVNATDYVYSTVAVLR